MPFQPDALRKIATAVGDTTPAKIAARTGIHRGTLSHLFKGTRQPSLQTARRLAAAYGRQIDELVGDEAA